MRDLTSFFSSFAGAPLSSQLQSLYLAPFLSSISTTRFIHPILLPPTVLVQPQPPPLIFNPKTLITPLIFNPKTAQHCTPAHQTDPRPLVTPRANTRQIPEQEPSTNAFLIVTLVSFSLLDLRPCACLPDQPFAGVRGVEHHDIQRVVYGIHGQLPGQEQV
jgi:hypothetical protein